MMNHELTYLSIKEASKLITQRDISPVELVQSHLERIEGIDPILNSFITLTADDARKRARQAEADLLRGATTKNGAFDQLFGIPLALKDLYETKGVRTTAGSAFFADYVPDEDCVVVEKLSTAGGISLGKLNMHEIALGVTNVNPHFGACRNPWSTARISGGSSGGSASALAAGLCLGAMGSDTGGSIRIPASLCGVVGLKPTYGRISLRGLIPLSRNLDHAGPMARHVIDAALMLQTFAAFDPHDPYSINIPSDEYTTNINKGVKGWRIALAEDEFFAKTEPEIKQAVRDAGLIFEVLGAHVEATRFPGARLAARSNGLMTVSDAAAFHQNRLQENPDGFGDDVLQRLNTGQAITTTEYIQARHAQTKLRRQFERFFESFDILLTPTTPVPAPLIEGPNAVEQSRLLTRYTAPFNLTGLPAISLPCGFTSGGLPIGLQIVCHPWGEARLLRAALAYEGATAWHQRHPIL
ncbi:amidase [Chloroflexota bacterium]